MFRPIKFLVRVFACVSFFFLAFAVTFLIKLCDISSLNPLFLLSALCSFSERSSIVAAPFRKQRLNVKNKLSNFYCRFLHSCMMCKFVLN